MPPSKTSSLLQPNDLLGPWRIDGRLASGGMAHVYSAHSVRDQTPVAIKVLRADLSKDERLRTRMMREALVLSQLEHPNIVPCIDYGTTPDAHLYIVMPLLHGVPLDAYTQQTRPSLHDVLSFAYDISGALFTIHREQIIHRDLKPSNIFIQHPATPDDTPHAVLFDFGIAHLPSEHFAPLTATGEVFGSLQFMAPEQLQPSIGRISSRTDLYAFGTLLYWLVTRRLPFRGSIQEIFHKHIHTPPPSPIAHWSLSDSPDEELCAFILKLVEKSPKARPSSGDTHEFFLQKILDTGTTS